MQIISTAKSKIAFKSFSNYIQFKSLLLRNVVQEYYLLARGSRLLSFAVYLSVIIVTKYLKPQ